MYDRADDLCIIMSDIVNSTQERKQPDRPKAIEPDSKPSGREMQCLVLKAYQVCEPEGLTSLCTAWDFHFPLSCQSLLAQFCTQDQTYDSPHHDLALRDC